MKECKKDRKKLSVKKKKKKKKKKEKIEKERKEKKEREEISVMFIGILNFWCDFFTYLI